MKLSERMKNSSHPVLAVKLHRWTIEVTSLEQENERLLTENRLLKVALAEDDEGVEIVT